ncbi:MAG: hypothetical protein PHI41_05695 [Erysipelotrichaceae bacterium]|nr:hypothetical protein [Erysipelotrichaceae bacterium]
MKTFLESCCVFSMSEAAPKRIFVRQDEKNPPSLFRSGRIPFSMTNQKKSREEAKEMQALDKCHLGYWSTFFFTNGG